MPQTIQIPFGFTPRTYQLDLLKALDSGYKRAIAVYHRRAGKDKTLWNLIIKKSLERVGVYYYFFPEFSQGRRVIWDGMDGSGYKFLDHIPEELIRKANSTDMKIELLNNSIIQIIGTDKFDKVRGSNPVGCVFSEFAFQNPKAWDIVRPILAENGGWAVFNSTPFGKNHFYDMFENAKGLDDWFTQLVTVEDSIDENGKRYVSEEIIKAEIQAGMSEEMVQQEFYCFLKGYSDVITNIGVKDISEIKVNDQVLTHTNRYRKVQGVITHQYSGEIYKIYTIGNNKPIICTDNHPIRVCNDGINHQWVQAKDLKKSDRLCIPKPLTKKLKLLSEDVIKVLSWFIVEGSTSRNAVQFTLNEKELDYITEIQTALKNGFGLDSKLYTKGGATTIVACSVELIEFLQKTCGLLAENKRIPFDLIAGYEELVYNILLSGDGCIYKNQNIFSTISKTLAYQFQLLGNMIGLPTTVREYKNNTFGEILGRTVRLNPYKYVVTSFTQQNNRYIKKHKYDYSVNILKIEKELYDGSVYNLDVQYDHSYIINSRVVHNCSFTANAQGFYYLKQIEEADKEGRIGNIPYDPSIGVDLWFDIGYSDNTAIWFTQTIDREICVIDYYQNNSHGLEHYAKYLQRLPYIYKSVTFPHDIKKSEMGTGRSILEIAEEHFAGIEINYNQKLDKQDGIQAVRMILPICRFDRNKCSLGLKALQNYHREWDDMRKQFRDKPEHDWSSDAADAFRTLAVGLTIPKNQSIKERHMKSFRKLSARNWRLA